MAFRASFFFQAEGGIRDLTVTGVQTCALPISAPALYCPLPVSNACPSRLPSSTSSKYTDTCSGSSEINCASDCFQLSLDRKSTRLNSSHSQISYAVFCLKKKKQSR